MKRDNTEQVGDVIRRLLRQEGLETPLNEYRLVDAWKDVVGETISRYTTNLYIKNQVLYVHLSSSVLRQELMMSRQLLVRNLQAQVGSLVIVNIIFRCFLFYLNRYSPGWSEVGLFTPDFIHWFIECFCWNLVADLEMKTDTYLVSVELL